MKNKSLLTSQDIKNFILEEISKVDFRETGCYIPSEIAKKLNLTRDQIQWYETKLQWKPKYVHKKHKYFDLEEIIKSLDENNIKYEYQYDIRLDVKKCRKGERK